MHYPLRHERLDCYRLLLEVGRWICEVEWPRGDADRKDQCRRSSRSAGENLAEGTYRQGKSRLYHFRVAMGSAAECCATLDFTELPGRQAQQAKLRRAVAMINKLK